MTDLTEFVKRRIVEAKEKEREQKAFISSLKEKNDFQPQARAKRPPLTYQDVLPSVNSKVSYRSGNPLSKFKHKNKLTISLSRI